MSALSQQVTTRLKETDKQCGKDQHKTQIIIKKNPQKKRPLGSISKKITGGLKHVSRKSYELRCFSDDVTNFI